MPDFPARRFKCMRDRARRRRRLCLALSKCSAKWDGAGRLSTDRHWMPHPLIEKAKAELEQAQSQLDTALRAWDDSVSELWRTSLALTQAQRRVTHAHELLRDALETVTESE